jgi:hypothetical protein
LIGAQDSVQNRLLKVNEASRKLCISGNTLRRWADSRKIDCWKISSRGDMHFRQQDIEDCAIVSLKKNPENQKAHQQTKLLLVILVLLNLADAVVSQFIILNGYGVEGNSLLRYWVTKNQFVLIKAGASILAAILLWDLSRRAPKPTLIITAIIVCLYVLIVFWNIFVATTAA